MHVLFQGCFLVHYGAGPGLNTACVLHRQGACHSCYCACGVGGRGRRARPVDGLCAQLLVRKVCGSTSVRVLSASECLIARQTGLQHMPAGQGVLCSGHRVPLLP